MVQTAVKQNHSPLNERGIGPFSVKWIQHYPIVSRFKVIKPGCAYPGFITPYNLSAKIPAGR